MRASRKAFAPVLRFAWCLALAGVMFGGLSAAQAQPQLQPQTSALAAARSASSDFVLAGELTQGGWLRGRAPGGAVSVSFQGEAVPLASDGTFFIAFDRDAGPSAQLTASLANGHIVSHPLAIAPRAWNIEQIDAPFHPPAMPDAEFAARRTVELARIKAARAEKVVSDGWRQDFIWPVKGRISGRFGSQRIYRGTPGSYHSGLDIATGESGTPYVAPADGVVVLAAESPFTLEGNLLIIDHGMGLTSAFLHASELLVHVGDYVRQGQVLGRIGMTGRATGPHLHWSLMWHDSRLDPLLFLDRIP